MEECIFCAIAAGRAPGSVAYEDDEVVAFMTINPINPGHLMVLPRVHAPALADLEEETGARLFRVATRLARAIRASGLRCEGINFFLADGEAAFQEIPHFHLHVFPRFEGDDFRLVADWEARPPREELDAAAQAVKEAYEDLYGPP